MSMGGLNKRLVEVMELNRIYYEEESGASDTETRFGEWHILCKQKPNTSSIKLEIRSLSYCTCILSHIKWQYLHTYIHTFFGVDFENWWPTCGLKNVIFNSPPPPPQTQRKELKNLFLLFILQLSSKLYSRLELTIKKCKCTYLRQWFTVCNIHKFAWMFLHRLFSVFYLAQLHLLPLCFNRAEEDALIELIKYNYSMTFP